MLNKLIAVGVVAAIVLTTDSSSQAGLMLSVGEVSLDANGRGRISVFAEHDLVGPVPQLGSFALRISINRLQGVGSIGFLDDGETRRARNGEPDHLFIGTTALLFDAFSIDAGQQFDLIDSIGIFDAPVSVTSPRLIASVNVAGQAGSLIGAADRFSISVDPNESFFFDQTFTAIDATDITNEATVATVSANAVPEPSSFPALLLSACISIQLRKTRSRR